MWNVWITLFFRWGLEGKSSSRARSLSFEIGEEIIREGQSHQRIRVRAIKEVKVNTIEVKTSKRTIIVTKIIKAHLNQNAL